MRMQYLVLLTEELETSRVNDEGVAAKAKKHPNRDTLANLHTNVSIDCCQNGGNYLNAKYCCHVARKKRL
jgi:hypothetical protein